MEVHERPDQPPKDFVVNMEVKRNKIKENKKQPLLTALHRITRTGLYYYLNYILFVYYYNYKFSKI